MTMTMEEHIAAWEIRRAKELAFKTPLIESLRKLARDLGLETPERISDRFIARIRLDDENHMKALADIKALAYGTDCTVENHTIRVDVKGRKPKAGHKYGWGGSLPLKNANEADVYVGLRYVID